MISRHSSHYCDTALWLEKIKLVSQEQSAAF